MVPHRYISRDHIISLVTNMKSTRKTRVWARKATKNALMELCENRSLEPYGEEKTMHRLPRHDECGFVGPVLTMIPYVLVLIGAVMMTDGVIAGGLMVSGLGVLIVGAPGSGSICTGTFRITGPAGLIMIVLGVVLAVGL